VADADGDPDDRDIVELVSSYRDKDPRIEHLDSPGRDVPGTSTVVEISYGLDEPSTRWLVLGIRPVASLRDRARQVWTSSPEPVLLDSHGSAVAKRARELASKLGLPAQLQQVLFQSGRLHDAGKGDVRFQKFSLGNADIDRHTLAKSHQHSIRRVRRAGTRGLPTGWRHEQLSAALAAVELDQHPHRDLILRLIGTSHGRGRPNFPHTTAELLNPAVPGEDPLAHHARRLFDDGEWDEIIESTHRQWGVWACSYLEAILRAADTQISAEGR